MHEVPGLQTERAPETPEAAIERTRAALEEQDRMYAAIRAFYESAENQREAQRIAEQTLWPPFNAHKETVAHAVRAMKEAIAAFYEAEANKDPGQELPEGRYALDVEFANRQGETKRVQDRADLWQANQRGRLLQDARAAVSMIGLHNFGIQSHKELPTAVAFTLTHKEHPEATLTSKCWVDQHGHIVKL